MTTRKTDFFPINNTWVYTAGDSQHYAQPDFNDDSWKKASADNTVIVSPEGYGWLRSTITISPDLKNQDLFCSLSKILATCDAYLTGSKSD